MSQNNAESYKNQNHLVQKELFINLISELDIKTGFRCLDIGCGTGNFTSLLTDLVGKDGYVLGVDPDKDRINIARETYSRISNMEFLCVNAGDLPTDLPNFDVVCSSAVLHWMVDEEKWKTFQNVFALLKPDGMFRFGCMVKIPDVIKEIYRLVEEKGGTPCVRKTEMPTDKVYEEKLTECGFEIVKIYTTEHTFVFSTLNQFLIWLSATVYSEIDIIELCRENEGKLEFERKKNGEYLLTYTRVYALVKKPNKLD